MRIVIYIFILTTVTGCMSNPLYLKHDSKGNDSQEYFSNKTKCKLYANSSAPVVYRSDGRSGRDGRAWTNTYYDCMRGKGWYAVDKNGNKIKYKWCDQFDCF